MYGLNPLNSAALIAAAVSKRCLRSIQIYRSLSETAGLSKTLPVELSESVTMLTCESAARGGICNVYLIGTTHGTLKSCQEVRQLMRLIKPEIVFVELCPRRINYLDRNPKRNTEEINPSRKEFQVAYDEARKYGAKVMLGDRPNDITEQRIFIMPCFRRKFWANICQGLQRMFTMAGFREFCADIVQGTSNTNEHIEKQGKFDADKNREIMNEYPTWEDTVIIHERDRYMSAKLLEIARKHHSVVAVVGAAHVPGIQKNWKQPVDIEQLLQVSLEAKIFYWMNKISPLVFIIYIIHRAH